jgi:hypothetical protein
LSDCDKRKLLDETLQDARMLVLREVGLPRDTPDDHEKLNPPAMKDPDLKERVRRKAKEIMIDDELRKRRCAAQGWGLSFSLSLSAPLSRIADPHVHNQQGPEDDHDCRGSGSETGRRRARRTETQDGRKRAVGRSVTRLLTLALTAWLSSLEKKRLLTPPLACTETREDRVSDWRSFNKKKKKRTKGPEVLG